MVPRHRCGVAAAVVRRPGISPRPKTPHWLPSWNPCRRTTAARILQGEGNQGKPSGSCSRQTNPAATPGHLRRRPAAHVTRALVNTPVNVTGRVVDAASPPRAAAPVFPDPARSTANGIPATAHSLQAPARPRWRGGRESRGSRAGLAETSPPCGRLPPCSRARRAPRADPCCPHHRRHRPSPAAASRDGEGGKIRGGRRRWWGLGFRPPVALEEATRGGGAQSFFGQSTAYIVEQDNSIYIFFKMGNEAPASASSDAHNYFCCKVHSIQIITITNQLRLRYESTIEIKVATKSYPSRSLLV
jgi:hypothetical protein